MIRFVEADDERVFVNFINTYFFPSNVTIGVDNFDTEPACIVCTDFAVFIKLATRRIEISTPKVFTAQRIGFSFAFPGFGGIVNCFVGDGNPGRDRFAVFINVCAHVPT